VFVGRGRWGDVFDRSRFLRGKFSLRDGRQRRILFKFCRRIVDIRNIMEQLRIATSLISHLPFAFSLLFSDPSLIFIIRMKEKKIDVIDRLLERLKMLAACNACGRQFVLV